MEFIESVPKHGNVRPVVETVFNKSGTNISNGGERAFAKALTIDMGKGKDQVKYFICTHNNAPYDPNGPDSHREIWLHTELKSVSQQTFDFYVLYLKTKNSLYMTKTQRSFING